MGKVVGGGVRGPRLGSEETLEKSAGRRKRQEGRRRGVTRDGSGSEHERSWKQERGAGDHTCSWGKLEAGADRGDHRGRQEERGQEPREGCTMIMLNLNI